ncbi:hypothetical protein TCAL_16196 [Tigriopus californicus]|uniref:Uncharacterized protein n=1 Tax=Tigriopus californicus TaxID=6832 RepID=A0A553P321_TIGCA|nr:hypothetical protein TCAL_16196 [Tigriopus californicus]
MAGEGSFGESEEGVVASGGGFGVSGAPSVCGLASVEAVSLASFGASSLGGSGLGSGGAVFCQWDQLLLHFLSDLLDENPELFSNIEVISKHFAQVSFGAALAPGVAAECSAVAGSAAGGAAGAATSGSGAGGASAGGAGVVLGPKTQDFGDTEQNLDLANGHSEIYIYRGHNYCSRDSILD